MGWYEQTKSFMWYYTSVCAENTWFWNCGHSLTRFWGRASVDMECHRSAEVSGAVTAETHRAVPFWSTIPVKLPLHLTQSPGSVTITVCRAPLTPSCTASHWGQGQGQLLPSSGIHASSGRMTWTQPSNTTCWGVAEHWGTSASCQVLLGKVDTLPCPQRSVPLAWPAPLLHSTYSETIIYHQAWPLGLYELSVLERRETTFYIQHNRYLDIVDQ